MPLPKGGHRGMLMMAPAAGQPLVKITGNREATYNPGSNEAEADGMDAAHGFGVMVQARPSISFQRVEDFAQAVVWAALEQAEAGVGVPFCFYPLAEAPYSDTATRVSGTGLVKPQSAQSLSDPVNGPLEVTPAQPDWLREGLWTGTVS